jgi:hypothetical protein
MNPEVTYYQPLRWYEEVGGPPLLTRREIARIKRWLAKRKAQLQIETA